MAQMQADFRHGAEDEGIPVTRLINGAAAALSLTLLVGVGIWGYRTVMRDVSGVPVIRAAEGEMRIRPETPGGTPAAHQGLAVNAIAAEGTAARVPDQVTLAPRPQTLTDEDVAAADLPGRTPGPSRGARKPPVAEPAAVVQAEPAEPALDADGAATDAGIRALAEQLAAGVKPLGASADAGALPDPEAAVALAVDPEDGVLRSLRPRQRPAALRAAAAAGALPVAAAVQSGPIGAAARAAAVEEVDPATIQTGTRLAQLGAYDSEEDARRDWTRLHGNFEDYMEGKSRVIQKASSGGRTFYRLRAMGFTDLSDARRFCAAFVAQDAECIPVVTR